MFLNRKNTTQLAEGGEVGVGVGEAHFSYINHVPLKKQRRRQDFKTVPAVIVNSAVWVVGC